MNEKGDSTPPKLKLSRDLIPKAAPEKAADTEKEKPETEKPRLTPTPAQPLAQPEKPTLSPLFKKPAPPATPSNLGDFDPNDPFGDILPKSTPPPETKKSKTAPALELDRKRSAPLPELPSKPPPPVRNGSGRKLEETLKELEDSGKKHGPSSTPIIIALVLILVATGIGIWYVLRGEPAEPAGPTVVDATGKPAGTPTANKAPTGPIGRTKEIISNRPTPVIPGTGDPSANAQPAPPEVVEIPKPTPPPAPVRPAPKPRPADRAAPVEDLREAVSAFLTSVHVGGLRGGSQPRVMLNGTSYNVNETVDPNTGLVFSGIQDERLLFTDRNGIQYVKSF